MMIILKKNRVENSCPRLEMFYLNSIEQLENLVGLKEQLEVCLTCSRLLAAIQMLLLHQKLRCSNNKMTLTTENIYRSFAFCSSASYYLKHETIQNHSSLLLFLLIFWLDLSLHSPGN